jgi:hypothetical protein
LGVMETIAKPTALPTATVMIATIIPMIPKPAPAKCFHLC